MAGITGLGTTYNLPNYTGILFQLTPSDTPLFSVIGGLTGGRQTTSTEFEWQAFDLRAAGQNVRLEGADAPTPEARVRANITNVTQIHQETVQISYSKWAATGLKSGTNNALGNPIQNEVDWQVEQGLKQMVRDVEFSFISGAYQKPVDNTEPRRTRGLLESIETNVIDVDAAAEPGELTKTMIDELCAMVYDNGGIMEAETATLIVGSKQKRALTNTYATSGNYRESTRNVGGLNLQVIQTDFMTLNVMLNRHMPEDTVALVSLEQLAPVFLEVPGKGHFFSEPIARTGASERVMLYGEVGLAFGNERAHGKIINIGAGS